MLWLNIATSVEIRNCSENMEPSNWEGPLPVRSQSSIRKILEQVKSGEKNKAEAFAELRGILNSSTSKNLGSNLMREEPVEMSERVVEDDDRLQTQLLIQTPSRFSQEDRRMLINKLIEKRRRSDDKISTISPLTGANLSASELQHGNYRYDHDNYTTNGSYQDGDDEIKWDEDDRSSESDRNNQNGTSRQSRDSRDRGDAREEKGIGDMLIRKESNLLACLTESPIFSEIIILASLHALRLLQNLFIVITDLSTV